MRLSYPILSYPILSYPILSLLALSLLLPVSANACAYKCFITNNTYDGNLGGLSGADAKCATEYPGFKFARNGSQVVAQAQGTTIEGRIFQINTSSPYNNCSGWTSNSNTELGTPYGINAGPNGFPYMINSLQSNGHGYSTVLTYHNCSIPQPLWCCNAP
jgi:hypothetical protein